MAELRITELDFAQIKQNIKNYLKSQDEFADYDFDGSGLSILLDVLAYNTHYNAMIAHLQANEMFIDTAIKRASVVSIAKTLGYTPRSATASRARVDLTVIPSGTETSLTLGTQTKFITTVNGSTYTFNVESLQTAVKTDGVFTFNDVDLIEGTFLNNTFRIASDTVSGPLVLPVDTLDAATINVSVQTSLTNLTTRTFTRGTSVIGIDSTSEVYWLEENPDGKYQIVFGDNVLGKQLEMGNIVVVSYLVCNGSAPNTAKVFSLSGTIDGETNVDITVTSAASSGAYRENIDNIRFNAPKFNATRNRAVTAQDYKSLILAEFPRAKSVTVWGGEENVPPIFGKVYITLDARDNELITESDKNVIINTILRPRSVMSIQHEFVDADYLYAAFQIDVRYNPRMTTLTSSEIRSYVQTAVEDYFTQNLRTLDRAFFYSQFTDAIKAVLPNAIVGVLAEMRLQRRLQALLNTKYSKTIQFLTAIIPGSIKSTVFETTINNILYTAYIKDVQTTSNSGILQLVEEKTGAVLNGNQGSVSYTTGICNLTNLTVSSYLGSFDDLRIHAHPQELYRNIAPTIITTSTSEVFATLPSPSRNTIIDLDDTAVDSAAGSSPGLVINVTPYLENN